MISQLEYHLRRKRVAKQLKSRSIAIVCSSMHKTRSNDTEYPYRQESNFYYLTGFKEDNACLVFIKKKKKVKTFLFVEKKDPTKELWNGKRLGKDKAKKMFLVDNVFCIDELEEKLKKFSMKKNFLYYDFFVSSKSIEQLKKSFQEIYAYYNLAQIIRKMRLIKSSNEIKLIRKAVEITKKAHHNAISVDKSSLYEYQLQAMIENIFKNEGAYSDAYTSIVAGGNNANTLHYIQNDKPLKDGDLILIDAGCEYEYYASDITRTIPVNGVFSPAQKDLYNLVLDVQMKIISMIKPGVFRSTLHKKSEELLCEGMIRLGILSGNKKSLLEEKAHKKYYPHGVGHWLGIDVHDQAPYRFRDGKEIPFKEGMVLTIEPGLYCDKKDKTIPRKFRGIGIRIEDDILVTKDGYENLSKGIAKTIEEIEALAKIK